MTRHSFCQHQVSLVATRRINYDLTSTGHFENLTSDEGHDLIRKGHAAYKSICIVDLNACNVFQSPYSVSIKSDCQINCL